MVAEAFDHLSVSHVGAVTVCRIVPKNLFDERIVDEVRQELARLVAEKQLKSLVVNFSSVEMMGSMGLSTMVMLNRKVKVYRGRLILCGMRSNVHEVFAVSRLTKLFDIKDTRADALAAF